MSFLTFVALFLAAVPVPPASLIFDPKRKYTRKQIAAVLTDLGFPTTSGALQTMASRGGGPPYSRWGKWTLYTGGPARDWAEARCTPAGSSPPPALAAPASTSSETRATPPPRAGRLVHPSGIEGLIILARGPRYSARGFPA
jgi:hypothetical protein